MEHALWCTCAIIVIVIIVTFVITVLVFWCRLHVRENGKQKVCVSGLMENKVQHLNSLVRVSCHSFKTVLFLWLEWPGFFSGFYTRNLHRIQCSSIQIEHSTFYSGQDSGSRTFKTQLTNQTTQF